MRKILLLGTVLSVMGWGVMAQSTPPAPANPCTPEVMADPAADPAAAYACSMHMEQAALDAGYLPDDDTLTAKINLLLRVAGLPQVIAATSVGADTEVVLEKLTTLYGDSFSGELLYNGIETGLDGLPLGCSGCHNGETAPLAAGTWTRTDEVRLNDPLLAGYTVERYLVDSILHPNDYIAPDYQPNLMPDNFHARLDTQQLANLVAYLSSQDQLADEVAP